MKKFYLQLYTVKGIVAWLMENISPEVFSISCGIASSDWEFTYDYEHDQYCVIIDDDDKATEFALRFA